jgi:DNA-binding NtrC family response regulator
MENPKILIVDDDIDHTKSIQVILESKHYNVVTASDRNEGMEKIKKGSTVQRYTNLDTDGS